VLQPQPRARHLVADLFHHRPRLAEKHDELGAKRLEASTDVIWAWPDMVNSKKHSTFNIQRSGSIRQRNSTCNVEDEC
jgi:hypothetical protein